MILRIINMADDNQEKRARPTRPMGRPETKPVVNDKYGENFRHIVRIANTDVKGEKQVHMAIHKIKGVSFMFSNFICHSAKVESRKIAGNLTDEEVQKLEDVIKNPAKYKCPEWMLNRRKDYDTGADMHLINTDWDLSVDADMKRMKKVKSYKGLRHMIGQTVRGQRTKSNFRKNKGKVSLGVVRKAPVTPAKTK
jgi:small subunit ribosomal protein S13